MAGRYRSRAAGLASVFGAFFLLSSAYAPGAAAQTGVSDDRVSLPEGPGSLEGVGENASVNPNMGLMRYSVPFRVPEGFKGVTPQLGLSYSSGGGSSVAGIGWGFDVPSIERSTLRGLPDYDADDAFVYSGGEQLVRVQTDASGAVYRARFEKGFTRYTWHGVGTGEQGYWTAEMRDGTTSYFGATADGTLVPAARVEGSTGVFRYLLTETTDSLGHKVSYTWRAPVVPVDATYRAEPVLDRVDWVFTGGTAVYTASFGYSPRPDEISNAKSGREYRQTQLLQSVDVQRSGATLRSYVLGYEDAASNDGVSRLESVDTFGAGGEHYPIAFTFGYSRSLGEGCDGTACTQPYVVDMGSIGLNMAAGKATLLDLNGDALPDIVDANQPGVHNILLNQLGADGTHTFAAATASAFGAGHQLGSGAYTQVLDVDGDGFTDLLNAQTGIALKNQGAGDWDSTESLFDAGSLPGGLNAEFADGDVATMKFLDFNGDKRIDLVRSQNDGAANVTQYFVNLPTGGFAAHTGGSDIGAGFESRTIEFNDMNGDGLLDVVQVQESGVRYKMNLGHAQFSDWRVIPLNFAGGGTFGEAQRRNAELEDLNGDALADLVLVEGTTLRYWLNQGGNAFLPERTVTSAVVSGDLPEREATTTVLFADMNGNGSSDIVWIAADGATKYLELFPVRPNLLSKVENGIGAVIEATYESSVTHMARDGGASAWQHRLPYPNLVVSQLDHYDALTNVHRIERYAYHDGFYDTSEKRFRGFAKVEKHDVGDDDALTGREHGELRMTYDVGANDPYMFGNVLEKEQLSDGRSLYHAVQTFADCTVDGVPTTGLSFDVRWVCLQEIENEVREGADAAEWVLTRTSYDYDGYGNLTSKVDHGVVSIGGQGCGACESDGLYGAPCGQMCLGDESIDEKAFVPPTQTGGLWMLDKPWRERTGSLIGDTANGAMEESITYYDGEAFVGLAEGQLTHGLVSRQTIRKNEAGDTVAITRHAHDAHGNIVELLDPLGVAGGTTHRRSYTMDADGLAVTRIAIHLDDADHGAYDLVRDVQYDALWRKPVEATAYRVVQSGSDVTPRNSIFYTYDVFGRLASRVLPGGDTIESPTERFTYDLASPVSRIISEKRTVVGGPYDDVSVRCDDGWGRMVQERNKIDDGKWQVTGFTVRSASGAPQEVFQPYTANSGGCDMSLPAGVPSVRTRFDAKKRSIQVTFPDEAGGTTQTRTEYAPLLERRFTMNDMDSTHPAFNTPRSVRSDGLGRIVEDVREGGAAGTQRFVRRYNVRGKIAVLEGPVTTQRQDTDHLGRVIRVEDDNRGVSTYTYDDVGNLLTRENGAGQISAFAYDGTNRRTGQWDQASPDTTRITWEFDLPAHCAAGACNNTAGSLARVQYPYADGFGEDTVSYSVRGLGASTTRTVAGGSFTLGAEYDNIGRTVARTYPGDKRVAYTLDGIGRVLAIGGIIDNVVYNDRGDTEDIAFANGVTLSQGFDVRRRLLSTRVSRGGDALLDLSMTRDADGHITDVEDAVKYGGISHAARYTYDGFERLLTAELNGGTDAAETVTYGYDVGDRLVSKTSSLEGASPLHLGAIGYDDANHPLAATGHAQRSYTYDDAGRMASRGDVRLSWDYNDRLVSADKNGVTVMHVDYAHGISRLRRAQNGHETWYLGENFTMRDGVASIAVTLGDEPIARLEYTALNTTLLSDVAPAIPGATVTPAPDGAITAADAFVAQQVSAADIELTGGAVVSDVDALLAASARAALIGDADDVQYLHRNHQDSTVLVTDASGNVVEARAYAPYGKSHDNVAVGALREPTGYTDKELDEAIGMVHIGHRMLDVDIGRWASPDPGFETLDDDMGEPHEALSAYAYVVNNPISHIDEDGQLANFVIGGIIGGVSAAVFEAGKQIAAKPTTKVEIAKAVGKVVFAGALGFALGAATGGFSALIGMSTAINVAKTAVGVAINGVSAAVGAYSARKARNEGGDYSKAQMSGNKATGAVSYNLNIIRGIVGVVTLDPSTIASGVMGAISGAFKVSSNTKGTRANRFTTAVTGAAYKAVSVMGKGITGGAKLAFKGLKALGKGAVQGAKAMASPANPMSALAGPRLAGPQK